MLGSVLNLGRRVAAVVAILTLCGGSAAICAGWQATPEARMACCKSGASCPLHKTASHGRSSSRVITQAQADNCCAATSNRTQSSVAATTFALSSATALPAIHDSVVPLQEWRAFVPLPVSPETGQQDYVASTAANHPAEWLSDEGCAGGCARQRCRPKWEARTRSSERVVSRACVKTCEFRGRRRRRDGCFACGGERPGGTNTRRSEVRAPFRRVRGRARAHRCCRSR